MTFLKISGTLLLLLLAANLWWRGSSRRRSLPCPTIFAGFLESAWMERLIGTQVTLDRIGLEPGQRVLEVGVGPGRLLIPAAERVLPGGEVSGLDIQPGMIERLKARADRSDVSNLTTVIGDATQPHFPTGSFDVIFLCTVLGEIPDRVAALQQCYEALKDDGRLSITEIFPDPHFQSRTTVQRLAKSVGFRPQTIHGQWYFHTINFIKNGEA
ncbi:MAG: class I SAM-dependent methyltransferase [Chloroflexi bacterium]|nr:MAG: class I SAM-dependent methyltransferase [Chloroflexota bacterium]MBL1197375.1 class I SAM-dependent methyltransferase [Chloroflexota bacterium]NOH14671.1 class I SAM-dependent methyltransferase [Chloroflexota bacterium]